MAGAVGAATRYRLTVATLRTAFLLLLCSLGCVARADTIPPLPADWIEVSAGGAFTVMAPRGTLFERTPGIDSFTGVFNGPGFTVHIDQGAHADPLERDRRRAAFLSRDITVDGRPAKLVTARTPGVPRPYFLGLHVPHVRRSVSGTIKLTLTCELQGPQDSAIVEAIYRSVRFM
jgi:hypothetical protein